MISEFSNFSITQPLFSPPFPGDFFDMDYVSDQGGPDYGKQDVGYLDEDSNYPFGDESDTLMDEFSMKDGGLIPLLKMTYINKTAPKPCDKETTLYELNDHKLYKPDKKKGRPVPVKGKLSNCHESECER